MSEMAGPNDPLPQMEQPPFLPPPPEPLMANLPLVPFEDLEAMPSFWARVGAMFRLVFTNPMDLFDRVPTGDGFSAPWRFLLLLSVPVFLIMGLVFLFLGMGATLAALEQATHSEGKAIAAVMPIIFAVILLLMPLFSFLGMVIGGALNHFFLWMWGGLKPGVGVHQSIRAYGYASAFIQLGGLIPYLGILVQLAGMVVIGMGMARMHKTDTWRGICAVLTPLILLCCCLPILLAITIPTLIALKH